MGSTRNAFTFSFGLIIFIVICLNRNALAHRHAIVKRTLFSEPVKDFPGPEKNYTGYRVRRDSQLVVYHHEQTLGVVELGDKRELLNCELLEVRTKSDKVSALASLKNTVSTQIKIPFSDMNDLMQYCQLLDHPILKNNQILRKRAREINTLDQRGISSVFRGVYPGTKWCGAGDIAETYYDIGPQVDLDKCCRTHDLCPVKVAGLRTQYNITNYTPYTRSHCDCDEIFYGCLKKVGSSSSNLLGTIYFNIARPVCVEDIVDNRTMKIIGRRFISQEKQF